MTKLDALVVVNVIFSDRKSCFGHGQSSLPAHAVVTYSVGLCITLRFFSCVTSSPIFCFTFGVGAHQVAAGITFPAAPTPAPVSYRLIVHGCTA